VKQRLYFTPQYLVKLPVGYLDEINYFLLNTDGKHDLHHMHLLRLLCTECIKWRQRKV